MSRSCPCGLWVAWLTTVTVHYTVNALSAGKLALFIPPQMSSSPSFHIVLHKTTALKLCLLAFVCHVFGLFISFLLYLILFVSLRLSEGLLSSFFPPPFCLSRLSRGGGGGVVYLVIYAVRLSLSAFPLSKSIQK